MKKEIFKDIINILILFSVFFIVYFFITKSEFIYGSMKDWNSQHWVFPEYFRNLFYETHDLFPDFAFNLGSGQNIYNFSYYGLLSPIILFSYLLPFVAMRDYIIVSTIFMLLLCVVLIYFFIKKKHNSSIAFICGFIFLMATPLIFHSHRHIMFMNYMPFLIMGYYGVDRYFDKNKPLLLTISVFLMIMTSYFYSVSGIVSIILYGIYCFIKKYEKINFKLFFKEGIKFLIPILIAVLCSGILIVPTFYSLLNGRSSGSDINIVKLLIPNLNIKNVLYSSYSLGISTIAIFSLVDNIFRKKEDKFLSICLIITLIFPIVLYIMNGFLYVEAKVLIVFLPAYMVLIGNTLSNTINDKINIKKIIYLSIFVVCLFLLFKRFYYIIELLVEFALMLICVYLLNKKKTYKCFYLLLFPVLVGMSINFNSGDKFVRKDIVDNTGKIVDSILEKDESFYRMAVYDKDFDKINKIYDLDYYETTVYSSSSSHYFEDFYYNRIGNEIIFRSHRQMPTTNNLFYNIYMGNKYVISNNFDSYMYKKIDDNIYKNDNVLSVGYATDKLMSLSYYNSLTYPDNIYAFLNYTIVDDDSIVTEFDPLFEKIKLDYEIIESDVSAIQHGFGYYVGAKDKANVKIKINNNLKNKILIIKFNMNHQEKCSIGDTAININGIVNKLSCKGWKYNNNNYVFEYVLSDKDLKELDIVFEKGNYDISLDEVYTLDYSKLKELVNDVDKFEINRDKTKGDVITGSINVERDGYFNLSIPYDLGFNIYVDGEKIDYEKVDVDFIGFKIDKGHHDIRIEYSSPFKKVGIVLSIIGIILFIGEVFMVSIANLVGSLFNEIKSPKTKLGKFIYKMIKKYREVIVYLIVGVLTTVVSLITKWGLLFTVLDAENAFELQVSIIISWIISVLFAYVTNRIFVFCSKNKKILKEMISFFGARVLTLVMEMVIMWFFVTLLKLNTNIWVLVWTIVTQVLVIVLNYVFSKIFVFKKN